MAKVEAQTGPEAPEAPEASAKKKGKKSKMLALITLPLVAILTFFLMARFITPIFIPMTKGMSSRNSDKSKIEKDDGDGDGNSIMWTLGIALANPKGSRGRQIMKVGVALELASNDIVEKAEKKRLRLMDTLMMVLSSQTLDNVCSPEGKSELKAQLKQRFMLGLEVGPEDIHHVYFSEFIVQ